MQTNIHTISLLFTPFSSQIFFLSHPWRVWQVISVFLPLHISVSFPKFLYFTGFLSLTSCFSPRYFLSVCGSCCRKALLTHHIFFLACGLLHHARAREAHGWNISSIGAASPFNSGSRNVFQAHQCSGSLLLTSGQREARNDAVGVITDRAFWRRGRSHLGQIALGPSVGSQEGIRRARERQRAGKSSCCWQMFASFSRSRSRVPAQRGARYPALSSKPQQSAQVGFPPDKAL